MLSIRHGRTCSGHPRLAWPEQGKTWMAGISPAMTENTERAQRASHSLLPLLLDMKAMQHEMKHRRQYEAGGNHDQEP